MPIVKLRRRTAVPAIAAAALAAALLAPAASAVAAGPAKAPAPAAARSEIVGSVRTEKLIDGSTAKIYKRGAHHHTLKIVSQGYVVATLDANQRDTGVNANGMFVVFTADGEVRSWTGGEQYGPGTFKLADGSTAKVTKVGAHHARMQIVHRGHVMATLDANGRDTAVNANGAYIVLTADGTFSVWIP
ncbi:hypothetical protein [Streptomyces sp. XD-27]|uniref:hypothetical protein n=1 Tax=Streptomyces sp. XD-27 TaxID=3062779 RepID=UPI0026F443AF|nr:hypothetical protein [Streptomyces sp. XD-27]WKX71485.1 hypothetical protein Q3Y56_17610 [Streptomyces sp. XD-27]